MRVIKIIVGFFLLFAVSKEYVNASTQLGSFFNVTIIAVLFFGLLCAWLIGSGVFNRKLKLADYLKSLLFALLIFVFLFFINLRLSQNPSEIVDIRGLKIPLGKCMHGNRRIMPNKENRRLYCKCFIEKIIENVELRAEYQNDLVNNRADKIFEEAQTNEKFRKLGIENCFRIEGMNWTDDLANSMRNNWKKELTGTELDSTNNIDIYCDCLIGEFRKYPFDQVMTDKFAESDVSVAIQEKCMKESKK